MAGISLDQLHTLLVEPSTAQHRIIESYLRDLGVRDVHWVQSGNDALARIARAKPDLLISAMHLPDMTGTEMLETLRHGDLCPDVPFMLISSETHYRYLEPIRQGGAIAILPKPFKPEQLRTALYATLDYFDPGTLKTRSVSHEDLRVLLVDDSHLSRRHIGHILRTMGIENITEAENGQEAFDLVLRNYYDLIVTDLYMPEMDGKEFVEHVRHESHQPSVPILMVSSEQDASRLAVVQQAGVSAVCDKPFDTTTIKQLIENILD
jgi:two-component system chemotaxis response regulator CheY